MKETFDLCTCIDCNHKWNASDTEHFNFTSCELCGSTNIKSKLSPKTKVKDTITQSLNNGHLTPSEYVRIQNMLKH